MRQVRLHERRRPDASSRPHIAARVDDAVTGVTNTLFRRRGWQPRIVPYTGYGTTDWVRILARVLLAPPRGASPSTPRRRRRANRRPGDGDGS